MKGRRRTVGPKRSVVRRDLSPSKNTAKAVTGGATVGPSTFSKKNVTTIKWPEIKP